MALPTVHFIVQHRADRSPGQRFRHEQYLVALRVAGFGIRYSPLLTAQQDRVLYQRGHYLAKAGIQWASLAKRRADVRAVKPGDIVFIYREALLTGSTRFERAFKQRGAKLVYDFDDAIWLPSTSKANRWLSFLKNPNKVGQIIGVCDLVLAGNSYLADFARQFNPAVEIVPTTIDTQEYSPGIEYPEKPVVTIGWSGSITTIEHFAHALPALEQIKARYGNRVAISVVGDGNYRHEGLGIVGKPWKKDTELADLRGMDIGIMPLPDDPWARGKCGLKGLQYMALGIPTLMSPVGVNQTIVEDGVNGFLPATTEQWVERLSQLIESRALREQVGRAGQATVEAQYSVNAWRERYVGLFKRLVAQ